MKKVPRAIESRSSVFGQLDMVYELVTKSKSSLLRSTIESLSTTQASNQTPFAVTRSNCESWQMILHPLKVIRKRMASVSPKKIQRAKRAKRNRLIQEVVKVKSPLVVVPGAAVTGKRNPVKVTFRVVNRVTPAETTPEKAITLPVKILEGETMLMHRIPLASPRVVDPAKVDPIAIQEAIRRRVRCLKRAPAKAPIKTKMAPVTPRNPVTLPLVRRMEVQANPAQVTPMLATRHSRTQAAKKRTARTKTAAPLQVSQATVEAEKANRKTRTPRDKILNRIKPVVIRSNRVTDQTRKTAKATKHLSMMGTRSKRFVTTSNRNAKSANHNLAPTPTKPIRNSLIQETRVRLHQNNRKGNLANPRILRTKTALTIATSRTETKVSPTHEATSLEATNHRATKVPNQRIKVDPKAIPKVRSPVVTNLLVTDLPMTRQIPTRSQNRVRAKIP